MSETSTSPNQPKPWYRKKRIIIPAGVLAVLVLIGSCGTSSDTTSAPQVTQSEGAPSPSISKPASTPTPPPAKGSVSQENALRSAEAYLEMKGFSRQGLIDQLSSEYGDGYPVADATWAVDQLDVDWNEQAVRSGEAYLKMKGFSRQGLIDQLSSEYGDKFTREQATYAAEELGL